MLPILPLDSDRTIVRERATERSQPADLWATDSGREPDLTAFQLENALHRGPERIAQRAVSSVAAIVRQRVVKRA